MVSILYTLVFCDLNEDLWYRSQTAYIPLIALSWGVFSGCLVLAVVDTILGGLTRKVSYRVVVMGFLSFVTTFFAFRMLLLSVYSDVFELLLEKYLWGVGWGFLLYSTKWAVKPWMGKWFARVVWGIPLLAHSGAFIYYHGEFWTLYYGIFSPDHSAFLCGMVAGLCMFYVSLECWYTSKVMDMFWCFVFTWSVVNVFICLVYYEGQIELGIHWMQLYRCGYVWSFLAAGFKWSTGYTLPDKMLACVWVLALVCHYGFFMRWHVGFWSKLYHGLVESQHWAAICGVLFGVLALYLTGIGMSNIIDATVDELSMAGIIMGLGCLVGHWWYGGVSLLWLPWLGTYAWGFSFSLILVGCVGFIKSVST